MIKKTAYFLIILLFSGLYLSVRYPGEWLHNSAYRRCLAFYGYNVGKKAEIKFLYHKGLRNLGNQPVKIKAFIPGEVKNLGREIQKALDEGYTALVECSDADFFHTTAEGKVLAVQLYNKAYRIVIFDGGHHLPTLGMAPDVIIIPEIRGYAAHSYMQDAVKTETVIHLAEEAGLETVIVSVPRWALIKEKNSLEGIARKVIAEGGKKKVPFSSFHPCADRRISKVNGVIFAYVEKDYYQDINRLTIRIQNLGTADVNKIYLAFDYKYADRESALAYAKDVQAALKIPTYVVNEPFTVFDVLWGKQHVLWKQGDSAKEPGLSGC